MDRAAIAKSENKHRHVLDYDLRVTRSLEKQIPRLSSPLERRSGWLGMTNR
jgi:hypothetical protein